MLVPSARSAFVAELSQQSNQFGVAPMHVADDVEWAMLFFSVIPERLPRDGGVRDFLRRRQHEHMPEAFPLQPANRPAQLLRLVAYHVWPELTVGPRLVPLVA